MTVDGDILPDVTKVTTKEKKYCFLKVSVQEISEISQNLQLHEK